MHLTGLSNKIVGRAFWLRAAALMFPIGAGILSIPFVVAQLGIIFGLIFILGIGLLMAAVHLMVAELVLRTKNRLEITGIVRKYAGAVPSYLAAFVFLALHIGALVAYLIGEGESLAALFGGLPLFWAIGFLFVGFLILRRGTKAVAEYDFLIGLIVLVVLIFMSGVGFYFAQQPILFPSGQLIWWMPYGVLLFAFHSVAAIPEAGVIMNGDVKAMRRAVLVSSLSPIFFYSLFAVAIILVTGLNTTEVATIGLGAAVGRWLVVVGNVFAVGAMSISFLTLGEAVRRTFQWDFSLPARVALGLALGIPLLIYFAGAREFVKVIAWAGSIFGSIEIGLLIFTYYRMHQVKSYEENSNFRRRFWRR